MSRKKIGISLQVRYCSPNFTVNNVSAEGEQVSLHNMAIVDFNSSHAKLAQLNVIKNLGNSTCLIRLKTSSRNVFQLAFVPLILSTN